MNNKLYVGIDPSINSTGVVIRCGDDDTMDDVKFYIVKNNDHEIKKDGQEKNPLTKAEQLAQISNKNFKFILYDKTYILKEESSYEKEMKKTLSFINIIKCIKDIIDKEREGREVYACIEGISYGSATRTSAIYDLAGLNYMIRQALIEQCGVTKLLVAPPGHVKKFATGNGAADKTMMIAVFEGIFPDLNIPKKDDIADAYFMSLIAEYDAMGQHHLI